MSSLNICPTPQYLSFLFASIRLSQRTYASDQLPLYSAIAMGLLDKLWDDTVAGPPPDTGLGKLRKFRNSSNSGKGSGGSDNTKSYKEDKSSSDETVKTVTRSIMIVKPPGYQYGSPPISPAGSTPPASPFSGGGEPGSYRFRRRSTSDAYDKSREARPRSSPPPYDV